MENTRAVLQLTKIGKILREIRESKEITQTEIAKKTGLSKQMISKIESGENSSLTTFLKYCNCIGVDLVKLLDDELNTQTEEEYMQEQCTHKFNGNYCVSHHGSECMCKVCGKKLYNFIKSGK